MDPHDPQRISLYLDDELAPEERARIEAHLAGCARCRETREAFLKLRELLRAEAQPAAPVDQVAQRRALREILRQRPLVPFWRRPVTLPAPGLAALVAALVVALGTLVAERLPFRREASVTRAESSPTKSPLPALSGSFDPARFDRGGRLETYVAVHPRNEER